MDTEHTPGKWTSSREDMDSYAHNPDDSSGEAEHVVYVYRGQQPRIAVFAGKLNNARQDARLIAAVPDLLDFARDVASNYDHDEDAHKYGTRCRECEAEKVISKAEGTL